MPYLKTIHYSPWFLIVFAALFCASFYWHTPTQWVYLAGLSIGIYCAVILPISWKTRSNALQGFVFLIPCIVFSFIYKTEGFQALFFGLSIATAIWAIFKKRVTRYEVGCTKQGEQGSSP